MSDSAYNVLFLCTGNSARSIMGEAILNHLGGGRFRAFSAGSYPKGAVHPLTLKLLDTAGIPTAGLRSKSWDEFAQAGAPEMDFVFTVCANAAAETCPVWPGQPITAHWGVEDPAAVTGSDIEKRQAFRDAFRALENRIKIFCSLRLDSLGLMAIQREVEDIGRAESSLPAR
jgi:arsenate reductase